MSAAHRASIAGVISEYFAGRQTDECLQNVKNAVLQGSVNLLEVVECLGPQLTSQDRSDRATAVRLLAGVLQCLPLSTVNEPEASALLDFLCDRMKDHYSVFPEVLAAFLAMAGFKHLPAGGARQMLRAVFADAEVQTMTQGHRRLAYQTVSRLLSTRESELLDMGAEFVLGYIQMFDGEKDPRNLVIAFDTICIIARIFDPGSLAEDLFEVCACYYPIDFNPPSGDPHGVTKEELVAGLSRALSASPLFAQYCLPMLVEKLSSDLQSAWLDSLHLLKACCSVYRPPDLAAYSGSLRDLLVARVLSGSDDVAVAGRDAIRALTERLASDEVSSRDVQLIDDFVDGLLKETKRQLADASLKLASPACDILEAAMHGGGKRAVTRVLANVLPLLVEQLSKYDMVRPKEIVLGLIVRLLETSQNYEEALMSLAAPSVMPVVSPMVLAASGGSSLVLRSQALRCIVLLAGSVASDVAAEQAASIAYASLRTANGTSFADTLRVDAARAVGALYCKHCTVVQRAVVPLLREVLCIDDDRDVIEAATGRSTTAIDTALNLLAHMAGASCASTGRRELPLTSSVAGTASAADVAGPEGDEPALALLLEFLHRLCRSCRSDQGYSSLLTGVMRAFALVARQAAAGSAEMSSAVASSADLKMAQPPVVATGDAHAERSPVAATALAMLLHETLLLAVEGADAAAYPAADGAGSTFVLWPDEAVVAGAETLRIAVSACSVAQSEKAARILLDRFFNAGTILPTSTSDGDCNAKGLFYSRLCSSVSSADRDAAQLLAFRRQRIELLQAFICSMRREVDLPGYCQLLDRLLGLLASRDRSTVESASKIIASVVNKSSRGSVAETKEGEVMSCVVDALRHRAHQRDVSTEHVLKNLTVCLGWLTKALLLRGDPRYNDLVNLMMELLDDPLVGGDAAACCELILHDDDADALSVAAHAVRRLFYKQHFFTLVLPHVLRRLSSEATDAPNHVLYVASYLLKYVPKQVLLPELNALFPAVVKALTSCDEELQLSMLVSLKALVADAAGNRSTTAASNRADYAGFLASYSDSIIPSLSSLGTTARRMSLRVAALDCLGLLLKGVPVHVLLPHRTQVLRGLAAAVDDKKRLVRKAAVETRNEWFLLGSC